MRIVPLAAAILAGFVLPAGAAATDRPTAESALTLRLRDLPLTHVLYSLFGRPWTPGRRRACPVPDGPGRRIPAALT